MVHAYTPPRSDTFSFLVFTLIVATIGLTIKHGKFRTRPAYQHLTTVCLACIIFVIPPTIYLRLALSPHYDGLHGWRTTRNLLFIESGVQLFACGILAILQVLKYKTGPEPLRSADFTNLHCRLNSVAYDAARDKYGEEGSNHFFENNIKFWRFNMAFFWYRYLVVYIVLIPFSLACNMYIAYTLYRLHIIPTVTLFADSIFFIVFGVTTALLFTWF
ncbi:MAG: hypothetical protein M1813_006447 [Trichoglossum hirsutum]|jgi:hypothetical protein|nr:MAG: hypothetical protein M1813_007459 [Trichoglossum hirsutum]KAI9859904.1 MAG: hypothetical protein M1813_006447 [Trichoglossum hirsutum]